MPLATDATLPVLPAEQPEFAADPNPFVEVARRQHPWLAKFSQGYLVHGYQANKDLLADDQNLVPGLTGVVDFYDARGTPWGRFMEEMLIQQTGDRHKRLRASVALAFTPRRANQMRPLMRRVISELLDGWAPKCTFDFAEFASYFPITVMCGLLGVSAEPIPRLRHALDNQLASLNMDASLRPALMAGYDVMWNFVDQLVVDREQSRKVEPDSLLDALIATKNAGQLDEEELRSMLLTLLFAGYDTSKNAVTLAMYMLLQNPGIYERCARDKAYCTKVLEELLRHSTIATPYRVVAQDFEYDGFRFPKGAIVVLATPLAGRDPTAFPDAMAFDPERVHTNRHVAFGRGGHMCLGMFLARAQIEEGLHLITQRLKNSRVTGDVRWRPFLGAWGLRTLPIAFDPAPAREASPAEAAALLAE